MHNTRLSLFLSILLAGSACGANISITKKVAVNLGEQRELVDLNLVSRWRVAATRDGGFVCAHPSGTNYVVEMFSASGTRLWLKDLPVADPSAILHSRQGELIFVAGVILNRSSWRLVRVSNGGAILSVTALPFVDGVENEYHALTEIEDGFLLVGAVGRDGTSGYAFVRKLSPGFQVLWQRDYGDTHSTKALRPFFVSTDTRGGYLFGCDAYDLRAFPVWSISPQGATNWTKEFAVVNAGGPNLRTGVKCADGGFVFAAELSAAPTDYSAQFFGETDYWLIKVDPNGRRIWDRSFGGAGPDTIDAVVQAEDGGFLVSGTSVRSGVTGNKGLDGDGTWILKLDSRGLKEAELITPGLNRTIMITAPHGYRLAGSGWVRDLQVVRKARLDVSSTASPYNVDVGNNLLQWTNLIVNFRNPLTWEETMEDGMKFFRAVDGR